MKEKITLSTIADMLDVSTATVSLALRDSPLVAETTREKIKQTAREIGYIYNRRAASLRTSRSGIIGVMVHDIMNPFFAEILISIEEELGQHNQTFLLCNHRDDLNLQRNFVDTLLQFGADGLIFSPAIGTKASDIDDIQNSGLPVIMVARYLAGTSVPIYRGDDKAGLYLATKHMIELGHRDIAFIGGRRETSTGRDRRDGYLDALREANIEPNLNFQMGSQTTRKSGYDCVRKLFSQSIKPTGIACFNDLVAVGVMSGLRSMGIVPGEDISVTGYDNIAEAEITSPGLTSVWNGQQEAGKLAARAMINMVRGSSRVFDDNLIQPKLVIRESTRSPN